MGPEAFQGVSRDLSGYLYRVYSRFTRIPEVRAHTRGPWFQPCILMKQQTRCGLIIRFVVTSQAIGFSPELRGLWPIV